MLMEPSFNCAAAGMTEINSAAISVGPFARSQTDEPDMGLEGASVLVTIPHFQETERSPICAWSGITQNAGSFREQQGLKFDTR